MRALQALLLAVSLISLVAPAFAQEEDNHVQRYGEEDKELTDSQKAAKKAADRAYQKSLNNIPDKGGSNDPWGAVRSDPPKQATAAKPKKTKTGSAEATK
jgi:hypothetical protein